MNLVCIIWLVLLTCKALLVREVFPRKFVWVKMRVEALSAIPFEATGLVRLGEFFTNSAIWTAIQIRNTLKSIGYFPVCWFYLYLGLKQPNIAWGFKYFKLYASLQKEPEVTKCRGNTHSDPIFSGRWRLHICMQTRLTSALQGYSTLQGISFTLPKFCGFGFVGIEMVVLLASGQVKD